MRILFVTPRLPSPIRGRRAYDLVRYLSRRHELYLLSFRGVEKEDPDIALQRVSDCFKQFWTVSISYPQGISRAALRVLTRTPMRVAFFRSRAMADLLEKVLKEGEFDLVYVKRVQMVQYFASLDTIPILVDLTDCLSLSHQTLLQVRQSYFQKLVNFEELPKMREYERWVVGHFPNVTVCSEKDRDALKSLSPLGGRVKVIPNGVDTEYYLPVSVPSEPNSLVFVGYMGYPPNVDAMHYFADCVLPLIRREVPDCRVRVVGPNPHPSLRRLEALGNLHIEGYVPDTRPYLAQASVAICPVRSGSGMKNKILEPMAMGKPVVATRESLSGIDARPGNEVLIADNAEEFASHVIKLLRNPALASQIGIAARQLIERTYSIESVVVQLERVLEECVEENVLKRLPTRSDKRRLS